MSTGSFPIDPGAALPAGAAAAVEMLLNRTPLIMWATDDQLRLQWVRGGGVRMLGLDQLCGIGRTLESIFDCPGHPIVERHAAALSGNACSLDAEWMDRSYEIWIEPLREGNAIKGSMAIALDVTDARRAQRSLVLQSGFDLVTGALTRQQLCQRMETLLGDCRRGGREITVVSIDIDGFGALNECIGTSEGDQILRTLFHIVEETAPTGSLIARVGADEFAVVFEGMPGADSFSDRLHGRLEEPLHSTGRFLHIGISAGTAAFPRDGDSVERLLVRAAAAARHARENGGRRTNSFSNALTIDSRQRVQIESDLREALRRNELFLVYQPQIRLDDESTAGVEVLLRWRRDGEVLPAWKFIGLAEESSAIIPIGEWVIDTALAQLKQWRDAGLDPGRMAINIGARQLGDDAIVGTITRALEKHGVPASAVDIEITETAAMRNVTTTARLLEDLRALGLEISVDDFGTGYSSLSYLRRFAVTGLKIDRSFVADLSGSETAGAIVKAIIATARAFGMRLIAEGVETEEQAALLRASGCSVVQGFLYSQPLDATAMTEYLRSEGTRSVGLAPGGGKPEPNG